MMQTILSKFKTFREQLFSCFGYRADATMNLVDSLSGNINAQSIVQLSMNPAFERRYGSVRDAISNFDADPAQHDRIEQHLIKYCSRPTQARPFRLLVVDCTAAPRKYSKTLEDKGVVHAPNVVPGNKPITVGHQYSIVGFLPEQNTENANIPWMLPLSVQRVATSANGIDVAIEQFKKVLPAFNKELTVNVGDTAYSNPKFIHAAAEHEALVIISRLHSNRNFNRKAKPKKLKETKRRERGHELWYGEEFKLKDEATCGTPDDTISVPFKTRKGKQFTAHIKSWHDILMRQKNGMPMNEYPFTVVRITIMDEQNNQVYKRPMWLMVAGKRRHELTAMQIWQSYIRRYDIEHFFKFGKSRLLMDKFQTPEVAREESWWLIACIAYAQLYMARELANNLPTPWEKYLPQMKNNATVKSARQVQKSFATITSNIGTPASAPKPRGNPLGRITGTKLTRREHHPIIFKGETALQRAIT